MDFHDKLIAWYHEYKRNLPWRDITDPYRIWLSEIILQQTRVDQGLSYYHAFIEKYPDIFRLAAAKEDDVLKLWQGLGYYSRARNLHYTAKYICNQFDGKFPGNYREIVKLKGIGPYTAAAIASFSFNEAKPAIDGNVNRVLSRIFGVSKPIDSTKGKKKIQQLAEELIPEQDPGTFNQAIMEFGALQCVPKNPDCPSCPFVEQCYAFQHKKVDDLPLKSKKTKQRNRFFNYLFVEDNNQKVLLRKRTGKGIWQNLYEFPLIETKKQFKEEELINSNDWEAFFQGQDHVICSVSRHFKHILSHQKIHARFWEVKIEGTHNGLLKNRELLAVKKADLEKYAVPKLIDNYLLKKK